MTAVATPFAAYPTTLQGADYNVVSLRVRNLRTGAVFTVQRPIPPFGVEQASSVTDLVVMPSGTVAWIGEGRFFGYGGQDAAVGSARLGQPANILEEGPGIDLHSLQLHGNRLTWLNEGVPHSAEMP